MTPEPLTDDVQIRRLCDRLVTVAAEMMVGNGASIGMALDRMLTFSAAQAVKIDGAIATAAAFRHVAEQVEKGLFAHLEPERRGRRH